MKKIFFGLCLMVMTFVSPVFPGEVIQDPKPTHIEMKALKLEFVYEIPLDIDDTHFMARPQSLAVGHDGAIFIYDSILKRIYKFDKHYKFERSFGRQGRGLGEFSGMDMGMKKLYYGPDHNLYVCETHNRRITVFSNKGKHIKDIRLPDQAGTREFFPVVDQNHNYYMVSDNEGAIDIYNNKLELTHSLLDKNDYDRFVVYEPHSLPGPPSNPAYNTNLWPRISNTYYDVISPNRLLIYLVSSSRIFMMNQNKVISYFDVWPKEAIATYKKKIAKAMQHDGMKRAILPFMDELIVDRDDNKHFYLSFCSQKLYKFNLSGQLTAVLSTKPRWCRFAAKRNHLFYGIRKGHIHIYKVKSK